METNLYKKFAQVLSDVEYLVERNEFEIFRFDFEKNQNRRQKRKSYLFQSNRQQIQFKWNPILTSPTRQSAATITARPTILDKNFSCKLCPKKIGAIRNFTHRGKKPVLVLHYTSEFRKGQPALTKSNPNLTLRTSESEDLFDRLIKKVFGFSLFF